VSALGNTRVKVPERAKRGEEVEIRAMIQHPMESGFRLDNVGRTIPRNIVDSFTCTYGGKQVFRGDATNRAHQACLAVAHRIDATRDAAHSR
jgi:sulfur-oxidizing protein SoxZ